MVYNSTWTTLELALFWMGFDLCFWFGKVVHLVLLFCFTFLTPELSCWLHTPLSLSTASLHFSWGKIAIYLEIYVMYTLTLKYKKCASRPLKCLRMIIYILVKISILYPLNFGLYVNWCSKLFYIGNLIL